MESDELKIPILIMCKNCRKIQSTISQDKYCGSKCRSAQAKRHIETYNTDEMSVIKSTNYEFARFRENQGTSSTRGLLTMIYTAFSLKIVQNKLKDLNIPEKIEQLLEDGKITRPNLEGSSHPTENDRIMDIPEDQLLSILHNWVQLMTCSEEEGHRDAGLESIMYSTIGFTEHVRSKSNNQTFDLIQLASNETDDIMMKLHLLIVALEAFQRLTFTELPDFKELPDDQKADVLLDVMANFERVTVGVLSNSFTKPHAIELSNLLMTMTNSPYMSCLTIPTFKTLKITVCFADSNRISVEMMNETPADQAFMTLHTLRKYLAENFEKNLPAEFWFAVKVADNSQLSLLKDTHELRGLHKFGDTVHICEAVSHTMQNQKPGRQPIREENMENGEQQSSRSRGVKPDTDPSDFKTIEFVILNGYSLYFSGKSNLKINEIVKRASEFIILSNQFQKINQDRVQENKIVTTELSKVMSISKDVVLKEYINGSVNRNATSATINLEKHPIIVPIDSLHVKFPGRPNPVPEGNGLFGGGNNLLRGGRGISLFGGGGGNNRQEVVNLNFNAGPAVTNERPTSRIKNKKVYMDHQVEEFFELVKPKSIMLSIINRPAPLVLSITFENKLNYSSAKHFLRTIPGSSALAGTTKNCNLKIRSLELDFDGLVEIYINTGGLDDLFPADHNVELFSSLSGKVSHKRADWPLKHVKRVIYEREDLPS